MLEPVWGRWLVYPFPTQGFIALAGVLCHDSRCHGSLLAVKVFAISMLNRNHCKGVHEIPCACFRFNRFNLTSRIGWNIVTGSTGHAWLNGHALFIDQ